MQRFFIGKWDAIIKHYFACDAVANSLVDAIMNFLLDSGAISRSWLIARS